MQNCKIQVFVTTGSMKSLQILLEYFETTLAHFAEKT